MNSLIKHNVSNILNINEDEIIILDRLMGGRSNFTYKIKAGSKLLSFRIPGKNAEVFVDRSIEKKVLETIETLNISNSCLWLDETTGYKIGSFVEGEELTHLNPLNYLTEVATIMKKLHNSNFKFDNDYNPCERLEKYENLNDHLNPLFFELKEIWLQYYNQYLKDIPLKPVHGDAQTANFIVTSENEILLLDWEFAGNNDPIYDIACFGNYDFNMALGLFNEYFESPTINEKMRLYLWRAFQCLQWYNVALYKHKIGLSEELELDFKMIAEKYLSTANDLINEIKTFKSEE